MSERTFVLQVTQTRSAEISISESAARRLFPEADWDNPQTSHAGNMEDSLDGGSNIPAELLTRLDGALAAADNGDSTFDLWEV